MKEQINYDALWKQVVADSAMAASPAHGPDHWWRVQQNGLLLARTTGARLDVVRLFAVFHDSRRVGEFEDPEHGWRGAEYARRLRGEWFEIDDEGFRMLFLACTIHSETLFVTNPTISTCLDADRLDLVRVGIVPHPEFMNTEEGAQWAQTLQREATIRGPQGADRKDAR